MNPDFPTTQWTLVESVRSTDQLSSHIAEGKLCDLYWRPIYAYFRRSGWDRLDAEDLTQGFFNRILQRQDFAVPEASKGKLRSYLLAAASHYQINEAGKLNSQKRGGNSVHVPLVGDSHEEHIEACLTKSEISPGELLDQIWAIGIVERAFRILEDAAKERGVAEFLVRIKPVLFGDKIDISYADLAVEFDTTVGAIKAQVFRLRERFKSEFRNQVAATLGSTKDLEEELEQIRRLWCQSEPALSLI